MERVEVMYQAPARYQVRGAMINIRLRHSLETPSTVQGKSMGNTTRIMRLRLRNGPHCYTTGSGCPWMCFTIIATGKVSLPRIRKPVTGSRPTGLHILSRTKRRNTDGAILIASAWEQTISWGKINSLSGVYNGSYTTSHIGQYTRGTQMAESMTRQTSWLHNGRLDYQTPFG